MALFVKLDASYAQDPKILDLDDERSELLFIRSLAYCKAHLTDGLIHRRALHQIAPFGDEVHAEDLAADLVRSGLWTATDRGWRVTSWLKRNPASEEILTPSKGRELAHQRHHVKKGIQKEGCPFCFPGIEDPQVVAHDAVRDAQHAMPYPEPYPEPEPSSSTSPQLSVVAEPLDDAAVEIEVRKAIGRAARQIAATDPTVQNPGAASGAIGQRLREQHHDEITERVRNGEPTDDVAAWLADPLAGFLDDIGDHAAAPTRLRPVTAGPECKTCGDSAWVSAPGESIATRCPDCNPDPLAGTQRDAGARA